MPRAIIGRREAFSIVESRRKRPRSPFSAILAIDQFRTARGRLSQRQGRFFASFSTPFHFRSPFEAPFREIVVFLENEAARSLADFSTSAWTNIFSPASIVSLQRPLRKFFRHLAFRSCIPSRIRVTAISVSALLGAASSTSFRSFLLKLFSRSAFSSLLAPVYTRTLL